MLDDALAVPVADGHRVGFIPSAAGGVRESAITHIGARRQLQRPAVLDRAVKHARYTASAAGNARLAGAPPDGAPQFADALGRRFAGAGDAISAVSFSRRRTYGFPWFTYGLT
jgi:hypothetical protein